MYRGTFRTLHLLILILVSFFIQGQNLSDVAGSWAGYIDIDGKELKINLTFTYSDEILDGTIDIPDQGAFTLPVEVVNAGENSITFQFQTGHGPATFYGDRTPEGNQISGEFNQFGEVYPFVLKRNEISRGLFSDIPERSVIIPTGEEELAGNLILRETRSPLVILIAGSGSNTRNLDIGGFKVFQQLSERLYREGYSTYRYDAPGIGESTGNQDATLQEMTRDLISVIDYLRTQYAENISGVVLLGHNQGGIVASMAAHDVSVNGVILAATPFLTGEQVITGQIKKIAEVREISDEIVEQNLSFQQDVYDVVYSGTGWTAIETQLAERLEAQIRELPVEHQNALGDMSAFIQSQVDRQLETAKSRWFKSWLETDPVEVIAGLDVPAIALFGEKDTQILPSANLQVADSLASTASVSLQTQLISDGNHLFQEANTGMPTEYGMLDHNFSDQFIDEISEFLQSLTFNSPG